MRRVILLLAPMALGVVLSMAAVLLTGAYTDSVPAAEAQTAPAKPNFVFILADDMRKDDLRYMPKTRSVLGQRGMTFANAYASYGLCCPSRATILRGQYAHNHGVWGNSAPSGGWAGFKANGNEQDNVATRLAAAGYRTAYFGKYFNGYDGSSVPKGWSRWYGTFKTSYLHWSVNDNGTIRRVDDSAGKYHTDVLRSETQQFIANSDKAGKPFFAYVGAYPPHGPVIPAPRDEHAFDGERAPRLPSFDEADVSDKPPWIQQLPRLGDNARARIDNWHEGRVETLQALDDLVGGVVGKLRDSGQLSNTYIVFTSDNGWHHGEHRIPEGKSRPYEESIRMPLLIRGPGVQAGSTTNELVVNTDYLPTFTDLAGISTPGYVDGRSLRPILEGSTSTTWRTAFLLELKAQRNGDRPALYGVRTSDGKKYIEYRDGERELFDLSRDPYELRDYYSAGAPPTGLASRIDALKTCAGTSCRSAENGP